jgi:hypothetical protein
LKTTHVIPRKALIINPSVWHCPVKRQRQRRLSPIQGTQNTGTEKCMKFPIRQHSQLL